MGYELFFMNFRFRFQTFKSILIGLLLYFNGFQVFIIQDIISIQGWGILKLLLMERWVLEGLSLGHQSGLTGWVLILIHWFVDLLLRGLNSKILTPCIGSILHLLLYAIHHLSHVFLRFTTIGTYTSSWIMSLIPISGTIGIGYVLDYGMHFWGKGQAEFGFFFGDGWAEGAGGVHPDLREGFF